MSSAVSVFPARLHCLDLLRAFAALAVVFWHWQHFFYQGALAVDFQPALQPWYPAFSLLYRHGALAVDMFFALSGFVFFWLYGNAIARRAIGPRDFAVLRFSRLYPLHLVTLVMVWLLQLLVQKYTGQPLVYTYNDTYHALLNLLLVPAWGWEQGWSFNAPVWSVSVEALLYLLFFCILRWARWPVLVWVLLVWAGVFATPFNYKIAAGLCAFFAGGLAFYLSTALVRHLGLRWALGCLALLAIVSWFYVYIEGPSQLVFDALVFPLTIAALAVLQAVFPDMGRRQAWLGALSYSTYLLHFPLQLVFVLAAQAFAAPRSVFYAEWVFALYFAILIGLGLASYRFFEAPMQRFLRRHMLPALQKGGHRLQPSR